MKVSSSRSSSVRASGRTTSTGGDVEGRQRVEVVAGQVGQQRLDVVEGVGLVLGQVVRDTGLGVVRARAAELLERDVLAGHGLHDVGAGDEHLAGLVDHDDEVGQRGGVDVPTGGRAHDQRDLRDDAGGVHVALEDLAVEAEGDHALLDARAAALVDADDGAAVLDREVLDLDDLLAVDLAERAAEDGHVLAEDRDRPAVDVAVAGDDAVAEGALGVHAEVRGAVAGELVELGERARVQQRLDALAGGHLAGGVLLLHGALGARVLGLLDAALEVGQLPGGGVDVDVVGDLLPGVLEFSRAHVSSSPTHLGRRVGPSVHIR